MKKSERPGPTLYAARISRHISQSRAYYALWRSNNTLKSTPSLMAVIWCSRLASRAAVPVPRPITNPCRESWNLMADVSRRIRRLVTAFQSTLNSPISLKYPLAPLVIKTNVYNMLSLASVPLQNSACTMAPTFCQVVRKTWDVTLECVHKNLYALYGWSNTG